MAGKEKVIRAVAAVLSAGLIFLTGCGQNTLSDAFDEETIREEAMDAIEYFNARDYQSILDMGNDAFRESITEEDFASQVDPYLDKCGAFQEISTSVVFGSADEENDVSYGGIVLVGVYESGKIQFTIGFDEEMKLVQFLIK